MDGYRLLKKNRKGNVIEKSFSGHGAAKGVDYDDDGEDESGDNDDKAARGAIDVQRNAEIRQKCWERTTHVQSTSLKKYSTMDVKTQEHYVEDGDDMYLH